MLFLLLSIPCVLRHNVAVAVAVAAAAAALFAARCFSVALSFFAAVAKSDVLVVP